MIKDILKDIIYDFKTEKFQSFFRSKNDKFSFPNEPIHYENENLTEGKKLAETQLDDGRFVACSFLVKRFLTERSGKKIQYALAKKVLKENQSDAGIFIFYDPQGNFRFSLIYANYLGKSRDWSAFRRFTYFVSSDPQITNKTFLQRIADGDFSSLQNIKEAFSVDPVTKQFYSEIQAWYFWAMDKIKFPEDYKYSNDPAKDKEIRNATNLIRLITRIIFIWFLTEKKLVPSDLFSKEKLKIIIQDFMKEKNASNFYNAVLQNLFFGTLNQKMDERKFTQESGFPVNKKEYGIKNLYRYADKFLISKDEVLKLFKDIPFLNGGLFDCLDKEDETGKVLYVDGFSRNLAKQSIIPDYLFFQENEEIINFSEYGLGKKPVKGLIEILNSYNFTIDENTPIDQEIALDPELLGKVFENLLASYNPETATTARKSTGSYYTPREIVDYMVEASLFEYLKGEFSETDEEKIKILLSYSEEKPVFSKGEKQKIISAIDEIKILDPACGSGAFPMGVLHKLVFALQKLDPENKYWYELQYQKALKESEDVFKQGDKNQRQEMLREINETFDEGINYPDYARKLYLIENCIYGVDIQPIAIQISKLRFFISLVLDQKVDRKKENFGIRALPNLETRFVAANTLIGLDKPQNLFYTDKIRKLEDEIKSLRHKYFTAKTRREKLNYQNKDKELRMLLAKELKNIGFSIDSSEKIAKFDLYDQNASADFFDAEWMFGIKNGFDIVIANPPYIRQEDLKPIKPILEKQGYQVYNSTSDIYTYFYEKGWQALNESGHLTFITSNKWMRAKYGEKIRKFFKDKTTIKQIIDFNGYKVFDATVDTNIMLFQKTKPSENIVHILNIQPDFTPSTDITNYFNSHKLKMKQSELDSNCFTFGDETVMNLKKKIEKIGTPLKNWDVKIYRGVLTGFNEAFIIDTATKEKLCKEDPKSAEILKPILRGRDISRYYYRWADLWVIFIPWHFPLNNDETIQGASDKAEKEFEKQYPAIYKHLLNYKEQLLNRNKDETGIRYEWYAMQRCAATYYPEFEKEKIVWNRITNLVIYSYVDRGYYVLDSTFFITGNNLKYIVLILNSKNSIFWMKNSLATLGEGMYGAKIYIEQLPIPKISASDQKPFIDLADKILAITKDDDYLNDSTNQAKVKEYERQIDQMVYQLYSLTEDEIKIVEGD